MNFYVIFFLSGEPPNYKNHQQLTVLPLSPSQITPTTTPPKNYGMSPRMVSPPQRAPPPYHPPPPPSTVIYHNGSKLVSFFFSLSNFYRNVVGVVISWNTFPSHLKKHIVYVEILSRNRKVELWIFFFF